ncbi:hypothetical protein [Halopseudomonas salegens]|uniref:Cytochrome oxidase Cu insertion factor (SCO1/SenC/PrrC family) n=1 Tax=Halopseudomonas salegens TaxID=1434072 RepID=A0A1H2HZR1_9GAMM|nr:hypothetical protein [Halopseudomonas salegens]SDU37185.1 hypothetical protein SAMN05216210_3429 [Halopseudomonas salegens]
MSSQESGLADKPKGQLKLLLIMAIVIGPMVAAWVMVKMEVGIPTTYVNHSTMVPSGVTVQDWSADVEPLGFGSPWRLLVTAPEQCDNACLDLIHRARQIHVALNRDAVRARHVLLLGQQESERWMEELQTEFPQVRVAALDSTAYQQSLQQHAPELPAGVQLWLVDPLGAVVLQQGPEDDGKQLLEDLKHLLKLSKVG